MRNDLTRFADTMNINEIGHVANSMPTLATPATTATTATTVIFGFNSSGPVTVSAKAPAHGSVSALVRAREGAVSA